MQTAVVWFFLQLRVDSRRDVMISKFYLKFIKNVNFVNLLMCMDNCPRTKHS
jgi:hypothetical protein